LIGRYLSNPGKFRDIEMMSSGEQLDTQKHGFFKTHSGSGTIDREKGSDPKMDRASTRETGGVLQEIDVISDVHPGTVWQIMFFIVVVVVIVIADFFRLRLRQRQSLR
jgi:hypothetical protein